MHSIQAVVPTKLVLYIFLIVFTTGCYPVQDIIPAEVDSIHWFLSPSGDKLLYDSNTMTTVNQAFVRFLATGQEVPITDCPLFRWLDDESIYCYNFQSSHEIPVAVISNISAPTAAFFNSSIKTITAGQVEVDTLLKQAKAICRLQHSLGGGVDDSLLILDKKLQENTRQYYHVIEVENLDEVLQNYNYTSIPLYGTGGKPFKKVYSPDKAYYSLLLQNGLGVYDATNDRLLAEVKRPSDRESIFFIGGIFPNQSGGWAADSSGVYFQIFHTMGLGPRPPVWPIQKLCVSGKC